MSWYAVRAIREAGVTTRAFLLPVDRGRWLRLVALSLIVGVGWLTPAIAWLAVRSGAVPGGVTVAVLLSVTGLLADAYGRFALLSALRSRRLRPAADARWRLSRAVRWIVTGFGAGVVVVAAAVVVLRLGWLAATGGAVDGVAGVAATTFAGGVTLLVGVGVVGVLQTTLSLLPATMLATGTGGLASWRRLRRAFAGHRGGFLGYLFVRGLVALAVTLLALLASGALVASLAVVAFVVLVGVFGTVSNGVAAMGGATFVAAGGVSMLALAVLPVRAATITYLAGYDLATLGAADPDLALLDDGGPDVADGSTTAVVLPDGTRAGPDPADTGTDPAGDDTGAFRFEAVEADEE